MNNFLPLNRQLVNCWIWQEKPFSKGQAWIDLLLLANYEDRKSMYKGELITCKRGDVNFSISYLATRWGWNRKTVTSFLKILENDGMIVLNATTHRTTITIVNYEVFNDLGTTKRKTKSQQDGQQSRTIKKEKKEKNIYDEIPESIKEAFMEFANMRKDIQKPITTKRMVTGLLNSLNAITTNPKEQIYVIQYCTNKCWQSFYMPKDGIPKVEERILY